MLSGGDRAAVAKQLKSNSIVNCDGAKLKNSNGSQMYRLCQMGLRYSGINTGA